MKDGSEPNSKEAIKRTLTRAGVTLIKNVDYIQSRDIINSLGFTLLTSDVVVRNNSKSLVMSSDELPLHTDHGRVKWIAWHCVRQSSEGGETLLLDTRSILHEMDPSILCELEQIHIKEHKIFDDDLGSRSITAKTTNGRSIYYAPWLLDERSSMHPAVATLSHRIQSSSQIKVRLESQDLLIIDNTRILHGRKAITGSVDRFLRRHWVESNQE